MSERSLWYCKPITTNQSGSSSRNMSIKMLNVSHLGNNTALLSENASYNIRGKHFPITCSLAHLLLESL